LIENKPNHIISEERVIVQNQRLMPKKDAATSNTTIVRESLGIQNIEDLEKIKEDSAESFIDPTNQLGMIL
jgi:hypothetical protein